MKKYLLIVILLTLGQRAFAQKIHITDSTNGWFCTGVDSNGNAFWTDYGYLPGQSMSVSGYFYHYLQCSSSATAVYAGAQFIREDTSAGLVYLYYDIGLNPMETILYNYNLHLGDTIHYSFPMFYSPAPYEDTTVVDSVVGVDSTLINGLYYKVFSLVEIDTLHNHIKGWNPYLTYIEGIGSVFDPVNAQYRGMFNNDTVFLKCFINHGVASPPVISVPFTFPMAGHVDTFINNCAFLGVASPRPSPGERVLVQPNPIDRQAKIVFSQSIVSGKLVVCNSIGQVVMDMPFENKAELIIGDKIRKPGMYFYEVMDEGNGAVYTGKFVKE